MKVTDLKQTPVGKALKESADQAGDFIAKRVDLLRQNGPEDVSRPSAVLFAQEAAAIAEPLARQFRPQLELPKTSNPQVVVLMPGFGTHPTRMRYMAERLEAAGHTVKRWGLGVNLGPTQENLEVLSRRVRQVYDRYGQKVVLVGWSLGGIFARELAKREPEIIAKVVTMGSPFSHSPYANNVWRLYELVTGHSVKKPPIEGDMAQKPPVQTVALWSPRDGVVSARSASGAPQERDKARALRCTHMGFSNSEEAIRAVAEELEEA